MIVVTTNEEQYPNLLQTQTGSVIRRAESLADQVYQYLRGQILTGRIEPGSRFVESKIATDLKISRSPVREAMRLLHKDGLVVIEPGIITLFKPSIQDFKELYELRLAIEPIAAKLAAERITREGSYLLESCLHDSENSVRLGEIDLLMDISTQFHDTIVQLSNNRRLQKVMYDISALTRYYRYFVFRIYQRNVTTLEEHWDICRAIQQRETDQAQKLMARHIERDLAFIEETHRRNIEQEK